jgi:hypothetical protein
MSSVGHPPTWWVGGWGEGRQVVCLVALWFVPATTHVSAAATGWLGLCPSAAKSQSGRNILNMSNSTAGTISWGNHFQDGPTLTGT